MSVTDNTNQIVAEFESHESATEAIDLLGKAGIQMANLSIVGRDYHTEQQPIGYVNAGDRMLSWGKFGAFWGSIWGILFGSAVIFVPGVGALVFAGWIVTAVAGAVEGAVIGGGLAALGAALASIGIPKDSIIAYETAIQAGNFLVMVRGTADEIRNASAVLEPLRPVSLTPSQHRVLAHA